uniref:ORF65 n=1 Tax=Saccharolobus islandicus TaxID=43080 RepID=O05474_SACIS|nr:ribbon-helix-helix domain-containing protein [Sulfolobus islandicus]AAB51528.1 ORF65 [Sulfolobus islandicus]
MLPIFGGKKEETWKGKRRGKIITIQLPDELYEEINMVCERYGIKKSEFIRNAVIEKLIQMQSKNT